MKIYWDVLQEDNLLETNEFKTYFWRGFNFYIVDEQVSLKIASPIHHGIMLEDLTQGLIAMLKYDKPQIFTSYNLQQNYQLAFIGRTLEVIEYINKPKEPIETYIYDKWAFIDAFDNALCDYMRKLYLMNPIVCEDPFYIKLKNGLDELQQLID